MKFPYPMSVLLNLIALLSAMYLRTHSWHIDNGCITLHAFSMYIQWKCRKKLAKSKKQSTIVLVHVCFYLIRLNWYTELTQNGCSQTTLFLIPKFSLFCWIWIYGNHVRALILEFTLLTVIIWFYLKILLIQTMKSF